MRYVLLIIAAVLSQSEALISEKDLDVLKSGGSEVVDPQVTITNGTIIGKHCGPSLCFLGIPFARPPVGQARFERPQPFPSRWQSPLPTKDFSDACPQFHRGQLIGAEDCLYLNIITPTVSTSANLAVMVFIHGGAYSIGRASEYSHDGMARNLAERGVVVVTIQYRLGVLGFLGTSSSDLPPNLGLMDQIQALKWVQSEIKVFGGDPTRVTIFGQSAGSSSVSLLTYSPMTRGLFSGAIMESGTAYCPFAIKGNMNINLNSSRDVILATKCMTMKAWVSRNFTGVAACLKGWDTTGLLSMAESLYSTSVLFNPFSFTPLPWTPVVGGVDGVLPIWPRKLASIRPKIPVLLGTNHDESFLWVLLQFGINNITLSAFNQSSYNSLIADFTRPAIFGRFSKDVQVLASDSYNAQYKPGDYMNWLNAGTQFRSGRMFFSGTSEEARTWQASGSPTYVYSFDYAPANYKWPSYNGVPIKGVFHSLELDFLFAENKWNFTAKDNATAEIFGRMWTNFARSGNPNNPSPLNGYAWHQYLGSQNGPYLSISPTPVMKPIYENTANRLWNVIVPQIIHSNGPTHPPTVKPTVNPCVNNSCVNGAQCIPNQNSYSCVCPANYIGEFCNYTACEVIVSNKGGYILDIGYFNGKQSRNAYILLAQQAHLTAATYSALKLHALWGHTFQCNLKLLPCETGTVHVQCSGTTLNLKCSGC